MSETVASNKVKTLIQSILNDGGIQSESEALKNQAWVITLSKISKYEAEIRKYKNKYKTPFTEFEKKLNKQKNEENFEIEDDYLDWKFAENSLKTWSERKNLLSNA